LAWVPGVVVGVGEAGVDGVVQVEALAVPGRDDGIWGDVGVVALVYGPVGVRQGGAGRDDGAVRVVEGERAAGRRGDEVPALVDESMMVTNKG
jgi:hypothetical protein